MRINPHLELNVITIRETEYNIFLQEDNTMIRIQNEEFLD